MSLITYPYHYTYSYHYIYRSISLYIYDSNFGRGLAEIPKFVFPTLGSHYLWGIPDAWENRC